jgi:hypothetical protein
VVDGDLESARGALVLLELEAEHTRVFGLNALCDYRGVLVVPSSPAELNQHKVTRTFVASVQFLHLLRLFASHYFF